MNKEKEDNKLLFTYYSTALISFILIWITLIMGIVHHNEIFEISSSIIFFFIGYFLSMPLTNISTYTKFKQKNKSYKFFYLFISLAMNILSIILFIKIAKKILILFSIDIVSLLNFHFLITYFLIPYYLGIILEKQQFHFEEFRKSNKQ